VSSVSRLPTTTWQAAGKKMEDEHDHSVPTFGLEAEGKPNLDPFTAVK